MENNKYLREEILRMSGVNTSKCMKCGKCSATCPAYDEMEYHPHQFVGMVESGDIEPLLNSESLYKCLSCFACVDRCPRGVEPASKAGETLVKRFRTEKRLDISGFHHSHELMRMIFHFIVGGAGGGAFSALHALARIDTAHS